MIKIGSRITPSEVARFDTGLGCAEIQTMETTQNLVWRPAHEKKIVSV